MVNKKVNINKSIDQYLFLTVFFIGATGIVFFKALNFPQWVATGFPACLMIIYFAYVAYSDRFSLREDR